jgi:hypothetical protein
LVEGINGVDALGRDLPKLSGLDLKVSQEAKYGAIMGLVAGGLSEPPLADGDRTDWTFSDR